VGTRPEGDLEVINALLDSMAKVTPEDDAKLQHLKTLILRKLKTPSIRQQKGLLFTAFADTANYLYNNLADHLLATKGLHTGKVTGKDAPKSTLKKSYDFQSLLTLFSPRQGKGS
jgi:ERCC4-related helicase